MNPIFSIALSGIVAATRRLEVSAANVANVDSTGALSDATTGSPGTPAPFQPLEVTQQPLLTGGTSASIGLLEPATTTAFQPGAPFANADGLVAAPNVDLAGEALNQIQAVNAYKANLKVLEVADDLEREAIDSAGRPSRSITA
jgi:flagellar basal-body rod protein FlgC